MSADEGVIRRDPPVSRVRGIDWEQFVSDILDMDGDWCMVGTYSPGMAAYLRRGCQRAFIPLGVKTGSVEAGAWMHTNWSIKSRTVSKKPHRIEIYIKPLTVGEET